MNPKSATILALGLVGAAAVISFAPVWTWQGKADERFAKAEKRLDEAERLQAQLVNTLKDVQDKFLPLKDAPPGRYRLLHEKKADKTMAGNTIYGYTLFEEVATGDVYLFDDNFLKFSKVHNYKKE